MRIGLCTNMIASKPDGTGAEYIEKLADIGFDYVELPLAEMTAMSEPDFAALAARVAASGISCEVCNNFFPKNIRLTGPNVDSRAIRDYVEKALFRAAALGVSYVVFGSGGAKNVPDGFPIDEGYRQVAALLRDVEPIAREHDITIAIEPLRKAECNLINTFAQGCGLAEDVDRDGVKVLVDYYHLAQENEPVHNVIENGRKYLRHVHFARNEGRRYPISLAEDESYAAFFAALRSVGYDGRISLEAYTDDFEREAPEALRFFRESITG